MTDYEELAGQAERGELTRVKGSELHGEAAREDARNILMAFTGAATIEEAGRIARGRPRLEDEGSGESPVWKVHAPRNLDAL
jgi:hypothetical protein